MASDPGETGRLFGRTVMLFSQLRNHDRLIHNYVANSPHALLHILVCRNGVSQGPYYLPSNLS